MRHSLYGEVLIRWSRWAEIDLEALKANVKALKGLLAPGVELLPVVKSDAYGHGLLPVARVLVNTGVYGLGVSEVYEGLHLRQAGFELPIILLSGFEPYWVEDILRLRLTPVITDVAQLEVLAQKAKQRHQKIALHLKVNTGMNRFGLEEEDLKKALDLLKAHKFLQLEGLMSHLACSERPEDPLTQEQLRRFSQAEDYLRQEGFRVRFRHLANSGGVIFLPEAHKDMVRPGLALYGAYPAEGAEERLSLKPVMSYWVRVIGLRKVKTGAGVGYGPLYRASKPRRLALVPVGYEDGYLRSLSNRGFAWVKGKRVPVVGAVSMKCLTLDVTDVESVSPGDKVLLLGGPRREVPPEELASKGETISYELFCALGSRAIRVYKG